MMIRRLFAPAFMISVVFWPLACKTKNLSTLDSDVSVTNESVDAAIARLNFLLTADRIDYYRRELIDLAKDQFSPDDLVKLGGIGPKDIIDALGKADLTMPPICRKTTPQTIFDIYRDFLSRSFNLGFLAALDMNKIPENIRKNFEDELVTGLRFKFVASDHAKLSGFAWAKDLCNVAKLEAKSKPEFSAARDDAVPYFEVTVPATDRSDMTLDTESYMTTRSTRALFWHVGLDSGKVDIEFHLGTQVDFDERLFLRGGTVLGEIKPSGDNYNKMYLVKFRDKARLTYAINKIGGADRLSHLARQLTLTALPGSTPPSRVRVYGKPDHVKALFEREITSWLEHLPDANRIILGQKAGIESYVRSTLTDQGKSVDPIYVNLLNPLVGMSDVVFKNTSGQTVRWRIFSNMNGDEMQPVANALVRYFAKRSQAVPVVYIGTAGMFPDARDPQVGLVVSPRTIINKDFADPIDRSQVSAQLCQNIPPQICRQEYTLAQVTSLYDETKSWYQKALGAGAHVVELETHHLAKALRRPAPEIYLLISDILLGEHSLDKADPSKRSDGKALLLDAMLKQDGGVSAIAGAALLKQDIKTPAKGLNASDEARLLDVGTRLSQGALTTGLLKTVEPGQALNGGGGAEIWIPKAFADASYQGEAFTLHLIASGSATAAAQSMQSAFTDSDFKLTVGAAPPQSGYVKLPLDACEYLRRCIIDFYNDALLEKHRLLAGYGKDGVLKYTQLPQP